MNGLLPESVYSSDKEVVPYIDALGRIYLHRWIDCQDEHKKWYEAQIIALSPSSPHRIKIHYKGWQSKFDSWIDLQSEPQRARPLHTFTRRPPSVGTLDEFTVGTKCQCLDSTDKWCRAEIVGIRNVNKLVLVHYVGWSSKYEEWINTDSYRIAPLHFGTSSTNNDSNITNTTNTAKPTSTVSKNPVSGSGPQSTSGSGTQSVSVSDDKLMTSKHDPLRRPLMIFEDDIPTMRYSSDDEVYQPELRYDPDPEPVTNNDSDTANPSNTDLLVQLMANLNASGNAINAPGSGLAEKSKQIVLPKEAVRMAPTEGEFGVFASFNGRLLCVQHSIIDNMSSGILRYDPRANSWTEWIPYPKGTRLFVGSVVVHEKRQMLYIFEKPGMHDVENKWITAVNLTEKTFKNDGHAIYRYESFPTFNPEYPCTVLVGDVIYLYKMPGCLKWNVETNQVMKTSGPGLIGTMRGAWYCDMQSVSLILIR